MGKDRHRSFSDPVSIFDPARIGESLFRYHWEAGASRPEWVRVSNTVDEEPNEEASPESGV